MNLKSITSNLIVATAYIIGGYAGLLLANLPSNAAAVWPAAGVALAAILISGTRVLPGILLGSIFIQTTSFLDASSTEKLISSLLIGTVISAAAMCQAWIGAILVRRIIQHDEGLLKERFIIYFCLLAGPVSCLLSASVGISTLWFKGILSVTDLPLAWSTWWIGDSIGVLVFTPIILCFFGKPRHLWQQRIPNVAIPLCFLSAIAFIVFKFSYHQELQYIEDDFEKNTINFTHELKNSINLHLNTTKDLKEYFDASNTVTADAFPLFVRPKLLRHSEIKAIEWIPKVLHKDRQSFEDQLGSEIKIPDQKGGMENSPAKEFYFPIQYLEPHAGNEKAMGYDIRSNPLALKAAEAACASGKVAVTNTIKLIQETKDQVGVVFYAPVYMKNRPNENQNNCETLSGFAASVFRLENEIINIHKRLPDLKLSVSLTNDSNLLYSDVNETDKNHTIPSKFQLERSYKLQVANQLWELKFSPSTGFITFYSSWTIWLIIVAGFLISGLSGMGLLMLTGRTLQTEQMIKIRTAELENEVVEHRLAKKAIAESETKYRDLVQGSLQGIFVHRNFKPLFANQRCADIFGYINPEEILQLNSVLESLWAPEEHERIREYKTNRMAGKEVPAIYECRGKRKDNSLFWFENHVTMIDWQGEEAIQATVVDITERKQAEEALHNIAVSFAVVRGEEFFNKVSAYLTDKLNVDYAFIGELVDEDKVSVLGGYGKGDVLGLFEYDLNNTPCKNVMGQSLCSYTSNVQKLFPKDQLLVEMNISGYIGIPLFDSSGKSSGIIVLLNEQPITNKKIAESTLQIFSDRVSAEIQRKQADEQLSFQASHDALTGLINRHEFERRAERLLATTHLDKSEHAFCFMDLDQFKIVNDTCGHNAGDELLRQLSAVLQNIIRHRDTLARLGGDEFGVLMEHCSLDDAHRVASSLQKATQDFQFSWEGHSFKVGVSMGLVPITETDLKLSRILSDADIACYMAKDKGRNRIQVYYPGDTETAQRHGEIQWVTRINYAIEEEKFCLYVQKIEPLDKSSESHYEILIRMLDENTEVIPPGAFLPAAERYNLISKIDRWVIKSTFDLLESHPLLLKNHGFFSINLSGQSLADMEFQEYVINQFVSRSIPPGKICFEITETAAITNLSVATLFLSKMRVLGCRFALDDFGSGLSSFGYLKNMEVDYLKIDGMFVKDIVDDPIDHAMVKSINEIGHVMGMQTIAEFVENDEIKGMLREIGVNYVQGYGVGKPMPFSELLINLKK